MHCYETVAVLRAISSTIPGNSRVALLLEASYFRQFSPLLSSDGVSLTDTVALLNLTSRIITRKVHIEKNLYRGEFSGIYWKYDIFLKCVLCRQRLFLSTEIRKAGVMIQLCTTHDLNTYSCIS
jgi:hypothetical protein